MYFFHFLFGYMKKKQYFCIVKHKNLSVMAKDNYQNALAKANQIKRELEQLNMPQRGHAVKIYDEDYPVEICVLNMNVPALADCQTIASKMNCASKHESLFNFFVFYIY